MSEPFLTFNNSPTAKRIARVFGGPKDGSNIFIDIGRGMKKINIDSGKIELLPDADPDQAPYVGWVMGVAGSGKTEYILSRIGMYHSIYPKNYIYYFSRKYEDPAVDKFKELINQRFQKENDTEDCIFRSVNFDKFLEYVTTNKDNLLDHFKNTLLIFDDIHTYPREDVKKAVLDLYLDTIECGRVNKIAVIMSHHTGSDYAKTRKALNESKTITIFPGFNIRKNIDNVLTKYYGIPRSTVDRICKIQSRAVTISVRAPMFAVGEREIVLLKDI